MSMRIVSVMRGTFVWMSRQKAHIPLCSVLNVCAVQLECRCQCRNPLGGTESDVSATPTVDRGRGDPIPDQAYIKKRVQTSCVLLIIQETAMLTELQGLSNMPRSFPRRIFPLHDDEKFSTCNFELRKKKL